MNLIFQERWQLVISTSQHNYKDSMKTCTTMERM
jgi:hypothetical protein